LQVTRTGRFKKAWKGLGEKDRALAVKAVAGMMRDLRHPSLRVKKIKGTQNIWEARASLSLRITFEVEGDRLVLRTVGRPDSVLDDP